MDDLHSKAKQFLNGPGVVSPTSVTTERLIKRYLAGGCRSDPEFRNQLSLCIQTAHAEAKRYEGIKEPGPQDARTFYLHAAAMLQDILAEVSVVQD
jgi:hypothetical protein